MSVLLVASLLAWRLLAMVDFAYPWLYHPLGMHSNIETFGPQNPTRPGFHTTDVTTRQELFAGIGRAIRNDGEGLRELRYTDRSSGRRYPLLTPAEVVHLEDVARVVSIYETLAGLGLLSLILCSIFMRRTKLPPPSARRWVMGLGVILGSGLIAVLAIGAEDIFYWLHTVVFPADHQWFFYYQESLMSMMMKAPVLFAGIGLIWLILGLVFLGLLLAGSRQVFSARNPSPTRT
nr:DUF1461 domain-containing protein [Oceanococcus sp. HetDA_MAG_MS8]